MISELPNAKRSGVISQISTIRNTAFLTGKLVAPTNLMAQDAKRFLENPLSFVPPGVVTARTIPDMIGEYVAVSTFTHCFDAFAYLGQACNAVLSGDPSAAVHLAYYAELRAAMAFLACEGIGVFHNKHCLVEASGSGIIATGDLTWRTHRFCWKAYEWLASTPQAMSLLNCISVDGLPITKWLAAFPSSVAVNMACNSYLGAIGLDIQSLSDDDQGTRGKASYRPRGIEGIPHSLPQNDVDLVYQITDFMGGPNGPRNSNLGVLILCMILRNAFHMNKGVTPAEDFTSFSGEVSRMIAALGPSTQTDLFLQRYCLTNPLPNIPLLTSAHTAKSGELAGVLSRTTLLCFHSLAYTRKLLADCGVTENELKFWWESELDARGALTTGTGATSQSIVQDMLNAVSDLGNISGSYVDRKSLWDQFADVLANSCRCERFAVAGFFA